jgi:hypothetical protein
MGQQWSTRTSVDVGEGDQVKLKEEIQNTVHQRDEDVWDKDKT